MKHVETDVVSMFDLPRSFMIASDWTETALLGQRKMESSIEPFTSGQHAMLENTNASSRWARMG